jgi:pyruvate/2-oxoglutarate dehydrogenase complex dihydrolipoamide acyltransferase (E2) component
MVLKIKRGLANLLEGMDSGDSRNGPAAEEEAPQRAEAPAPQAPQSVQPQAPQAAQPASRQAAPDVGWEEHLIQALAKAPEDVAQRLASCMDREVLLRALQRREDPYLKVALLLIKK